MKNSGAFSISLSEKNFSAKIKAVPHSSKFPVKSGVKLFLKPHRSLQFYSPTYAISKTCISHDIVKWRDDSIGQS